jgi:hypothetical protein
MATAALGIVHVHRFAIRGNRCEDPVPVHFFNEIFEFCMC